MIVSCEDCGKQYRVHTEKIRADSAQFRCRACGHTIAVNKPLPPADESTESSPSTLTLGKAKPAALPGEQSEPSTPDRQKVPAMKLKGIGIRTKLMFFLLVPLIVALVIGGYFSLKQMVDLSDLITHESLKIVSQMAEQEIADHARAVALQVSLYLANHPGLKKERFQQDVEFKEIAVQKVGSTGYTALHGVPDEKGVWRNWAHVNPKIVGIDMSTLRKPMGKAFHGFWKIFSAGKDDKESSGYYTWQDADGRFRDKFMVCVPVKGTPYYVASTTYLDEFTRPVERLKAESKTIANRARNMNAGVMLGTIVIVGLIIFFYGRRVTGNIKHLSEVADRISVGELDAQIEVRSKDEVGELAEAVSRMQDSLRLSIERLRRRRPI
ncbi:MAG TPA: HAMP domain-containing protein [Desulfatiglandales bacterium]|nr:HAMP domain-containing protein [Desulfatiglandales bacterium]